MFLIAFLPMLLVAFAYKELAADTPGLRHHLHLGYKGIRTVDRLDRWLGPGGVGDHRAGQCRRDRGHLHAALPASGFLGRQSVGEGRIRVHSHRRHDLGEYPRNRDRERLQAVLMVIQFAVLILASVIALVKVGFDKAGDQAITPGAELVMAERSEPVADRGGGHPVHLHLLGDGTPAWR